MNMQMEKRSSETGMSGRDREHVTQTNRQTRFSQKCLLKLEAYAEH